jgi:hypothetical protein
MKEIRYKTKTVPFKGGMFSNCIAIGGYATTTISYFDPTFAPTGRIKRREIMEIFDVYIVNRVTCKILRKETLVGSDEGDAALALTLTAEEQALKAEDDLDIVFSSVGSFEKRVAQRIKVEK